MRNPIYHTTKTIFGKDQKDAGNRIYFVSDPERVTHAIISGSECVFLCQCTPITMRFSPSRADTPMYFLRNRGGFEQVVLFVFVLTFNKIV